MYFLVIQEFWMMNALEHHQTYFTSFNTSVIVCFCDILRKINWKTIFLKDIYLQSWTVPFKFLVKVIKNYTIFSVDGFILFQLMLKCIKEIHYWLHLTHFIICLKLPVEKPAHVNPFMPSGFSHPSKLNQFISKIRDV